MRKKLTVNNVVSFLVSLVILVSLIHAGLIVYVPSLLAEQGKGIFITRDNQGINVTLTDRFELYFNATNGGEITRYYDLNYDPLRTNNLVLPANRSYQQPSPHSLYPLFSSILYNPYIKDFRAVGSTGGDGNATLTILGNDTQDGLDYVILQATARIMDAGGGVFEDVYGNANYVKSTWLIRNDGYIFLERTLYTPEYAVIQGKFRWYPFYLIRTTGFNSIATFYLFNTTYAYTYNVSKQTYRNDYSSYPELPGDKTGHFGVAAPFSNASLGGDRTNSILLVYDLDGSSGITEWKADCFTNATGFGGTEFGAMHEFNVDHNITTQTYNAMIALTHDPISEQNVTAFAEYFTKNPVFPLVKPSLAANKVFYELGEPFTINVSTTFDYNMINLSRTLTLTDESGRVLWHENYGIINVSQGEKWSNVQLLNHTLSAIITSDDYTFTFRLLSIQGIVVGSDSINLIVTVKARQFGKTEVGLYNATSYKDYKMTTRYLMPEDGWITSISMWFSNQEFEAKVAIYTHPEGKLIIQSESESITSTGWHNFDIPRTFLFSGLYGLSWKNSQNVTIAYDLGLRDQTARTPELYSYSFSPTFGSPEFYPVETSIYATYDPVITKVGVSSYTQTPSYDENVTVIAYANDGGILTGPVVLSYSTSTNTNWISVTMMPSEGLYTAQIPPQRYNTIVYYKVYAQDARGEPIGSEMHAYKVADFQPPTVSYLEQTPVSPNYNETVIVSANVSEPLNASGIKLVLLTYWNGWAWANVTMTLENALYTATIPPLPFMTTVDYTVRAFDYSQNVAASHIYSYKVADMFPPTAKIDGLTQTYLKGTVPVNVTGNDANFDKMELYISGQLVQTWNQSSSEIYYWDTAKYPDGIYLVKLIVYDKANNIGEKEISVSIDNTVPGWTLSLVAVFALITATLIGTWAYSTRRRKERKQIYSNTGSRIEKRAVKTIVHMAMILLFWYRFWIAAEILVWHKSL